MNLKEIGLLLVSLYVITAIMMAYKYYNAQGGVFSISRILVFKYFLRFIMLIILLFLSYNTLIFKQKNQTQLSNNSKILVAISSNCSGITWKKLQDKISEISPNGLFRLIRFDPLQQKWQSIIPETNHESFINLIEQSQESKFLQPKILFQEPLLYKPINDQFAIFSYQENHWIKEDLSNSEDRFFSKNVFNSLSQASYVPLYLVILLLVLVFIDIVFSVKGLKI
jgi:hypothetical protein